MNKFEKMKKVFNDMDIDEFINKVKENNELIIKTVTREGNILDKRIKYIFLSVDGKKIYYVEENSIHKLEYIFTSNEINLTLTINMN